MLKRLLRWLVCPICHDELNLSIAESEPGILSEADRVVMEAIATIQDLDDVDIITGALTCEKCRVYYPVHRGIPRMLAFPTEVAKIHAQENEAWINTNLVGFALPNCDPAPGEAEVLRNFSTEWTEYKWDGESYWNTSTDVTLKTKRYELGVAKHSLKHRLVLEVGIGIGGTADGLSRSEGCEIVGMDLGYAVDQARNYFGKNPRFHIIQGSVFLPPFRPGTFDTVYSHGVLHHTHSTRAAFSRIAELPKPTNGMLYVWLYSREQERATLLRRILMLVESVCRPVLSRLPSPLQTAFLVPTVPLYILYQNLYVRCRLGRNVAATYGWNEALHAARDRLTPPFAYRHTYSEISEWFQNEMYGDLELLRDEKLPEDIPETYSLNVGIRGFRKQAVQT
jgi:uncharacterized protein YbaR (Trm112 family)/SAM-dependent methyltransferase